MKYVGFVSLPIEGNPAAQLQNVLNQIESALVEQHADNVTRIGNTVSFSAGFLSLKRSVRGYPFSLITSGEIKVTPTTDCLMVDYQLSFTQLFILGIATALLYVATLRRRISEQPLSQNLRMVAILWLVMFAGNAAFEVSRFSKFLRQFPRHS